MQPIAQNMYMQIGIEIVANVPAAHGITSRRKTGNEPRLDIHDPIGQRIADKKK